MSKWYIYVILLTMVTACYQAPVTDVRMHVKGLMENDSAVSVITRDSVYTAYLDKTCGAALTLDPKQKADYAIFRYHGVSVPIYIEPNKNLEIFLKIENWEMEVKFAGSGAPKNEYLNNKTLREFYPDYKTDEAGIIQSLKTWETKLSEMLDSMHFDSAFTAIEKKRIHYLIYAYLPRYPSYQKYQLQKQEYEASAAFYTYISQQIPEEEELIDMPEYQTALQNLVQAFGLKGLREQNEWRFLKKQMEYIDKQVKNQIIKDFLMDKITTRYVEKNGTDHLEEIVHFYHDNVKASGKKLKFDDLCQKWLKLVKGQPSPTFNCLDIEGKEVNLTDLAGKYVYIDIWATWCRPCRAEQPYLEQLIQRYEGKDIAFVSISTDRDKKAWEKLVKTEQLQGIQLYGGRGNSFIESFVVRSIPRFILLDREGKIIEADMSRPTDPRTTELLDSLISL